MYSYRHRYCRQKTCSVVLFVVLLIKITTANGLELKVTGLNDRPYPPYRWYNYCEQRWQGSNIVLLEKLFDDRAEKITYIAPVKIENVDSVRLRESMISGEADAIPMAINLPYKTIQYSTIPVVKVEMSFFYPRHLGRDNILAKLRQLEGVYPIYLQASEGEAEMIRYAREQQLTIRRIEADELDNYVASERHFIISHKYNVDDVGDDRLRFNTGVVVDRFYLALADRHPWRGMMETIDHQLERAFDSGYISLIENAALQQWINLKRKQKQCISPQ